MRKAIIYAPSLFLPLMLYLGVIIFSGGADERLTKVMFRIPMIMSTPWVLTLGDFVLFIGLICLFVEIIKSASTRSDAIVNHALSMLLLVFCVVAFLLFPGFSTSVFFLLLIMCLLDVLAGPIISIVAARRDFGVGERLIS
ncbi:hypothetical protein [Hyphomonas pacifica]|uniref:Uncharacterized protein n=1 Tax=Hyphomonas pacifica TaxID=1280941 RepID=A0A062TVK3_9PROT|nr:hypothetical protein [Hyphomonas pacifica]KCZ52031.1 hypothetical protein HY2_10020 [Hyphomonas pacifica]RAN34685.1 hypothetical protein HY3_10270 [Hyphomonas pacifica]